ncbi:hypothetical protein RAS1_30350 [Phycisphaerae bacterium RAS1]|nr:hypothetical protein RAS1_30350 [Phycisphaerae bacterium RAS1]
MRQLDRACGKSVASRWAIAALLIWAPRALAQADNCLDATTVEPGVTFGTTIGSSNDGSANCGDSATSPDVWYVYTALEDCVLRLTTCGSTWDTVLSLHTACPGTFLNQLNCNDDSCSYQSAIATPVTAGNTYYIRVAGWRGATGAFQLNVSCNPPQPPIGADVLIGELGSMVQFGRLGDVVGCAIDSPLCNAGDEPLDWYPNPDPRHPFMIFNMYRLKAGRFEQIGGSWVKHGWSAAQGNACGLGCQQNPDNLRLGVGCSDIYSAAANAGQTTLGPRYEVDPYTGSFTYAGSHFDTQPGGHTPISHRLQLRDADIDPAQNPGATYFGEVYITTHDDYEHMNSVAREAVTISGAPGGTWTFNMSGSTSIVGPAIESWPGATRTMIPADPAGIGRCILGVTVTSNGDGTWHYEYGIYNHDLPRAIRSFSIPVPTAANVTGIDFSAVRSHDEPFSNDPWTATHAAGVLTWSTEAPGDINPGNPLRWGTLYNFRFNAAAPPAAATATLGLWQPGAPSQLSGQTQAPVLQAVPGDLNCDGLVNIIDINPFTLALSDPIAYAAAYPTCNINNGDVNGDGNVDVLDINPFVALLAGG